MQMSPYLNFQGDCEAAFRFYEECLGGKMGEIFRWGGTPLAAEVQPGAPAELLELDAAQLGLRLVHVQLARQQAL